MDYLVGDHTCFLVFMLVSGQNDRHFIYQKLGCFSFGESRSLQPDKLLERVIY